MWLEFSRLAHWLADGYKPLERYFASFNGKAIAIAISVWAFCAVRFLDHDMRWNMDLALPTLIFFMILVGVGVFKTAIKKLSERKLKRSADVIVTKQAIEYISGGYQKSINWGEISKVTFEWSRGLEDPTIGIDIEVYWVIKGANKDWIRIHDSHANRYFLLPALERHLNGFSVDYESMERRTWREEEGETICWQRSP